MAKAATDEQIQLRRRARRRLIGAIALVTLIAVILPWILEGEPRSSDQEIAIQIPSQDSGTFGTRVPPPAKGGASGKPAASEASARESGAGAAPAETGSVLQAEQEKVLAPPVMKGAPVQERPQPAKDPKVAPLETKKKAPVEAHDPASDGKQFVVQVAALADGAKAESLQKALNAKGIRSYTEVVKSPAGEVTRVRVGPFASRETAEQERAKLKALGYDGNVAPR